MLSAVILTSACLPARSGMEPVASGLLAAEGYYQQACSRQAQILDTSVSQVPWTAEPDWERTAETGRGSQA